MDSAIITAADKAARAYIRRLQLRADEVRRTRREIMRLDANMMANYDYIRIAAGVPVSPLAGAW